MQPDVVVIDLSMPEMNGLAATRALQETRAPTAIVALTRHDDDAYVQELLAAGAVGYVLKQSASGELLRAIRAAAAGERYLDPALPPPDAPRRPPPPRHHAADHRARGGSPAPDGARPQQQGSPAALDISVKTVEVHKANAMRKLGLRGRTTSSATPSCRAGCAIPESSVAQAFPISGRAGV